MATKWNLESQLEQLDDMHARGALTDDEYTTRRRAVLTATPLVATEKSGFPFLRVGCFGIIGIFVVLIIVGIAANSGASHSNNVASGGPGSSNAANALAPNSGSAANSRATGSSNGVTPVAGTNKGDVHVVLAQGASGQIAPEGNSDKKTQVTILQIVNDVKSGNEFEVPPSGKKWIGLEVLVTNVGTAEVNGLTWKLHDSQDFEHDQAFVIGAGDALETYANLTPGGKTQGWVYFEVASDASIKWLRADPNPFLKNDLYFDAAQ